MWVLFGKTLSGKTCLPRACLPWWFPGGLTDAGGEEARAINTHGDECLERAGDRDEMTRGDGELARGAGETAGCCHERRGLPSGATPVGAVLEATQRAGGVVDASPSEDMPRDALLGPRRRGLGHGTLAAPADAL